MKKTKKKKKEKNQKNDRKFHYDKESFFLDDVLKEIEEQRKQKKKSGFTTY